MSGSEIVYPFPNFNEAVQVWEWMSNFLLHIIMEVHVITYLCWVVVVVVVVGCGVWVWVGGGYYWDIVHIYQIIIVHIFQIQFFITILYILSPLHNTVIKNRIWNNFRRGACPVCPPLNPPLYILALQKFSYHIRSISILSEMSD